MGLYDAPDPPEIRSTELYGYPRWKPPRRPGGLQAVKPWELLADDDGQDGGEDDG